MIKNGIIMLTPLMLSVSTNAESNPPNQKAHESPINTLAGLMLNRMNATRDAMIITTSVLAMYA